ncbi:MAG: DUF3892 domain-containing protein [Sphingomonadales bacterium]|nr:DUF3892 domain-containing protein [Sphingomonadales bacterium]
MAAYEITAVRQRGSEGSTHLIDAVKVGNSLFLTDQIVDWIAAGTHRFWIWFQDKEVDVVVRQQVSSRRYYLTTEGGGFPPIALLSLPRF